MATLDLSGKLTGHRSGKLKRLIPKIQDLAHNDMAGLQERQRAVFRLLREGQTVAQVFSATRHLNVSREEVSTWARSEDYRSFKAGREFHLTPALWAERVGDWVEAIASTYTNQEVPDSLKERLAWYLNRLPRRGHAKKRNRSD